MKSSMTRNIALTVLAGGLVAVTASVVGLEPATREAALLGSGLSTLLGVVALTIKLQFSRLTAGTSEVKGLLSGQVLSFLLRLFAVGAGAMAVKASPEGSPFGFVVAFFAVYLLQQLVETRSLMAAYAAKSGVS